MTEIQAKTARGALHWSQQDLAAKVGVHHKTIANFENGREIKEATRERIEETLTAAGVSFVGQGFTYSPVAKT